MLAASEPWPSRQVLQEGGQILHGLVLYFDSMFMACVVTFHCHVLPQHATTCVFFKHMSWQFSIELSSSKAPHRSTLALAEYNGRTLAAEIV